jgi:hypothetical protein
LYGQTQDNIGLGFDLDDVSRTGTLIKRAEVDAERLATLQPFNLGLSAMGTNATFDNTAWDSGYRPSIVRDGETLHLDIVAGTYNHTNMSWGGIGSIGTASQLGGAYIELFPSAFSAVSFVEGDWFEFVFTFEQDADAGAFFYAQRDTNSPVLSLWVGSAPLSFSTTLFMALKSGGKKTFCFRGRATSTGTGAHLVWLVPNKNGTPGNFPSSAHRVTLTNLQICRIPA